MVGYWTSEPVGPEDDGYCYWTFAICKDPIPPLYREGNEFVNEYRNGEPDGEIIDFGDEFVHFLPLRTGSFASPIRTTEP